MEMVLALNQASPDTDTCEPQVEFAGSGREKGGGGGDHSLFIFFHVAFSPFRSYQASSSVVVRLLRSSGGSFVR